MCYNQLHYVHPTWEGSFNQNKLWWLLDFPATSPLEPKHWLGREGVAHRARRDNPSHTAGERQSSAPAVPSPTLFVHPKSIHIWDLKATNLAVGLSILLCSCPVPSLCTCCMPSASTSLPSPMLGNRPGCKHRHQCWWAQEPGQAAPYLHGAVDLGAVEHELEVVEAAESGLPGHVLRLLTQEEGVTQGQGHGDSLGTGKIPERFKYAAPPGP